VSGEYQLVVEDDGDVFAFVDGGLELESHGFGYHVEGGQRVAVL